MLLSLFSCHVIFTSLLEWDVCNCGLPVKVFFWSCACSVFSAFHFLDFTSWVFLSLFLIFSISDSRSVLKWTTSTRIFRQLPHGGAISYVSQYVDNWVWRTRNKRTKRGNEGKPRVHGVTPTAPNGVDNRWNVADEICCYSHIHSFSDFDILLEPSLGLKGRQIQLYSLSRKKNGNSYALFFPGSK